jgi:hypothetical protein
VETFLFLANAKVENVNQRCYTFTSRVLRKTFNCEIIIVKVKTLLPSNIEGSEVHMES